MLFKFGGNGKPVCCWWVGWGRKFWNVFGKAKNGSGWENCWGGFKGGGVVFAGEGELLLTVTLKEEGRLISGADNGGHTDSCGISRRGADATFELFAVDEG